MQNFLDKLRGSLYSKSSWFGVGVALIGLADQLAPSLLPALVPAQYTGLAVSLSGVAVWLLRWVTTQPLEQK
jgi:hypothetical protein